MLALWIVLAVVVVLAIVVTAVSLPSPPGRVGRRSQPGGHGDETVARYASAGTGRPPGRPSGTALVDPRHRGHRLRCGRCVGATGTAAPAGRRHGPGRGRSRRTGRSPPADGQDPGSFQRGRPRSWRRGSVDDQTWDDLEEALLRADVGVATTSALLDGLRLRVKSGELRGPDALIDALRRAMKESLEGAGEVGLAFQDGVTNVWLFVGVNGVGKTTTIGKIARQQAAAGRTLLLAAGDTFRAAAAEQLSIWADRAEVGLVRGIDRRQRDHL